MDTSMTLTKGDRVILLDEWGSPLHKAGTVRRRSLWSRLSYIVRWDGERCNYVVWSTRLMKVG